MGDVAMSVPVLRALITQNPKVKITVLSRAFLKPLFEDLPNVNFYAAEVDGKHKGLLGLYRLSKELKTLKIDAIADIHNVLRSKLLRLFFSFPIMTSRNKIAVIDKGRAEKKALTRTKNKIFKQLKSTHERYADVFRKLGFSVDLKHPQYPQKKELSVDIKNLIGNNDQKLIGIAPFAQYDSKMYPLDLMEKVLAGLSQNSNHNILLFGGGKKEVELLQKLAEKYENVYSLAGKIKLNDELKTIAHLHCMVSMDSANAHLAAMQGIKTITLWGVTHPFTGFAPFNQSIENAITPDLKKYPNIPCSIYGNKICDGYEAVMRSISPKTIVDKIEATIKNIPD